MNLAEGNRSEKHLLLNCLGPGYFSTETTALNPELQQLIKVNFLDSFSPHFVHRFYSVLPGCRPPSELQSRSALNMSVIRQHLNPHTSAEQGRSG